MEVPAVRSPAGQSVMFCLDTVWGSLVIQRGSHTASGVYSPASLSKGMHVVSFMVPKLPEVPCLCSHSLLAAVFHWRSLLQGLCRPVSHPILCPSVAAWKLMHDGPFEKGLPLPCGEYREQTPQATVLGSIFSGSS